MARILLVLLMGLLISPAFAEQVTIEGMGAASAKPNAAINPPLPSQGAEQQQAGSENTNVGASSPVLNPNTPPATISGSEAASGSGSAHGLPDSSSQQSGMPPQPNSPQKPNQQISPGYQMPQTIPNPVRPTIPVPPPPSTSGANVSSGVK